MFFDKKKSPIMMYKLYISEYLICLFDMNQGQLSIVLIINVI